MRATDIGASSRRALIALGAIAALGLAGCLNGDGQGQATAEGDDARRAAGTSGPAGREARNGVIGASNAVADPAMATPVSTEQGMPASAGPAEAWKPEAAAESPQEPETFTIDLANLRAYIPGRGWISADELRELYYNRPQELPPGADHDKVTALLGEGHE